LWFSKSAIKKQQQKVYEEAVGCAAATRAVTLKAEAKRAEARNEQWSSPLLPDV
jgi:hypothetical protein